MDRSTWIKEILGRDQILEQITKNILKEKSYRPCITFSREPGSGGKPIAQLVAKRLGFRIFDKKLVRRLAEEMRKPAKILSKVDEKERSVIMDWVQNVLNPDYVDDDAYVRNLCIEILSLARQGGSIIVGRGSNFIVPAAYGLHVQVVAPYKVRVARAIKYEGYNYQKARDVIRDVGEERKGFVQQYFGKNTHNPRYYDLTINTTFFKIEEAADIVERAYHAKFPDGTIPEVVQ